MYITIPIPNWFLRRSLLRDLERHPYLMAGAVRKSRGGSFQINRSLEYSPVLREFIADGMAENDCDALTFVRTVKRFPKAAFTFGFKLGGR